MKKLIPICLLLLVVFVGLGLYKALKTGEKSPIYLSGNINISKPLIEKIKNQDTLYLVLYDKNSPMPMPYGAVREKFDPNVAKKGKIGFLITKEKLQLMNENSPVPKVFRFKVRIDKDGIGGRDQIGDLTGELGEVNYGNKNVAIDINKIVE